MWRLFMEEALAEREPAEFPEPRVWPEWQTFTRGEYALSYDPNATPETTEEVETTPLPEPPAGAER
jgi:hypothetical protein